MALSGLSLANGSTLQQHRLQSQAVGPVRLSGSLLPDMFHLPALQGKSGTHGSLH